MRGQEQALCTCDECAAEDVVNAPHGKTAKFNKSGKPVLDFINEGQITKKLQSQGWAVVKNRLRCPKCEAKRKAEQPKPKEAVMAENVTQLRQPTPKQKREIIGLLETAYDDEAKRYRGTDTDLTIAEAIGGGVMFGWVAAIREDLFGPEGGNEEMETLKAQMGEWIKNADAEAKAMQRALDAFNVERAKLDAIHKRLDALNKTLGPKAVRA